MTQAAQFLRVQDVSVSPVEVIEGAPFWEQPWIDPTLQAWAFGPMAGHEARTYLVIDATVRRQVMGLFDLDAFDLPIECLFSGAAAEDLAEVAPYLVDLTLPRDGPTRFHRTFFSKQWQDGMGVLLRTEADFPQLRKHLRRFTRTANEDGRSMYFRFWEPGVMGDYFRHLAEHRPDRSMQLFCLRDGIWINAILGHAPALNRTVAVTPILDSLTKTAPGHGPFVLSPGEEDALYRGVLRGYAHRIVEELAEGSDLDAVAATEEEVLECVLRMRRFGIARLDYLTTLARWDLAHESPIEAARPDLAAILTRPAPEAEKMAALRAAYDAALSI